MTRATLPTEEEAALNAEVPELPPLKGKANWHPLVVQWWEAVWRSPMATEYLESDRGRLFMLAQLHQDFWSARNRADRQKAAAEIRQQGALLGLSPVDRYRLQWEVEKGEQAADRTESRRKAKRPNPRRDPREVLKVV